MKKILDGDSDESDHKDWSKTSNKRPLDTSVDVSSTPTKMLKFSKGSSDKQKSPREEYKYLDKNIKPALICPICINPFIDPVSVPCCGQSFCSECILKVDKCPNCRMEINSQSLQSNRNIISLADELLVECSMCKGGVERGKLKDHKEKHCPIHEAYQQVEQLKKKLEQQVEEKEEALQNRVEQFEKQVYTRVKLENSNKPIHLNVRGTILTVSLGDFIHNEREPDNLFKKMFTEQHPCYQTPSNMFSGEVYYIDCDPIVFKHILEWLQFGVIATELSNDMKQSITNVCTKFELKNLFNEFKEFNSKNLLNLHKFQKRSLNGYNFRDLSYCDFSGMNLENANFNGLILKGCNFSNCNLENANFMGCDLNESIFCKCIKKVDFSGSNLSNINFNQFEFEHVTFANAKIQNSKFENAIFSNCKISMHFNNFNELKFISSDFSGSIFEQIDFKLIQENLTSTQFNNCTFKNLDLKELKDLSKFKDNTFDSCLFNFEQFTNKHVQNIHFQNMDLHLSREEYYTFKFSDVVFTQCTNAANFLLSTIITDSSISFELNTHTKSKSIPQLLYRGSRDGFKAEQFHSKCDNQGPTLTVIKSEHNQIFGAFTSQSWKSPPDKEYGETVSDSSAFIFKICCANTERKCQFKKFNIKQNHEQVAICVDKDRLPVFGYIFHDISISSDCNLNSNSSSHFGASYELPNGYKHLSDIAQNYLAGSHKFSVREIEVFKINH